MEPLGPSEIGRPGRAGVWTRSRFNPGVLVWMFGAIVSFYAVKQAFDTYGVASIEGSVRAATFVVERLEIEPNYAWVHGRIEPGGIEYRHPAENTLKWGFVVKGDMRVRAQPGQRMRVWFIESGELRFIEPVSSMPCLPSKEMPLFWGVFAVGVLVASARFTYRAQQHQVEKRTEVLLDER